MIQFATSEPPRLRSLLRLARLACAALVLSVACHKTEAPDDAASRAQSGPPPTPAVLEHEPDDIQHMQTIPPRAVVLGEITPGKKGAADDDWYRVVAGPGVLLALHVELSAADAVPSAAPAAVTGPLDAQLELDDRDRNRLVLAHATSGEPALFPAVACFESCFIHLWGTAPAAYKLTVLGAPPREGQELEPNNRAIDASPLTAGKSAQGTIGAPDDEDWFRVTAQARPGQFLRVELSGVPGVRPELELRALADGALLASFRAASEGEGIFLRDLSLAGDIAPPEPPNLRPAADAGAGDAGTSDAGPGDAGAVNSASTAAAPSSLARGAADAPDAGAHASTGLSPQALEALEQGQGQLQDTAPREAPAPAPQAALDADAGAVANLAARANPLPAQASASPGTQDAGPAPTPANPSAPVATAPSAPVTATPAAPVATQGYYLVVRSAPLTNEKKAPRGANVRAQYTLATALEAGPGDLEAEPNDDPQHATWISRVRTGFLAPAGDSDWYRVRNEGKSVLRAEVTGLRRADLELSIYAAPAHPGEKLALLAHANEGGVREGELIPAVGIEGDALILVQCAQRELDGVKVRDCEDRDAPYTLAVALAADDGALEREPNDDAEHAQKIEIPSRVTGTLWPKRDVDVFRFQLDAPRSVSFRLSSVRGVDTMLTLRELKTSARGRATSEVIGTADASRGEGPEEIVAVPLKSGTYSIEVSSPRRDGSPTQPYVLQIK